MTRRAVPNSVVVSVLTEAGYRCAVPTCRTILAIDIHHMVEVADGGGNEQTNLLPLCPTCHALFHRGEISRDSIYAWKAIHSVLCSAFEAGALLSSSSKGYERETFISLFLSEVLPPIYRFGTGDIIDALMNVDPNRRSGQIDIVIEMPWAPSFPMLVGAGARLYTNETNLGN